jgi:hypothetical protein
MSPGRLKCKGNNAVFVKRTMPDELPIQTAWLSMIYILFASLYRFWRAKEA